MHEGALTEGLPGACPTEDLAGRTVRGILGDARPAERGSVSLLVAAAAAAGAAAPAPSAAQQTALRNNFTQFLCYGICSFAPFCEWNTAPLPAAHFAPPDDFAVDSWLDAAAAMGATQVCLTARHVDGFSLWPTAVNSYSVAS